MSVEFDPVVVQQLAVKLKETHGWSDRKLIEALKWIQAPTIHPIVSVREFMESPYYMGTKNSDGTSAIYPEVMKELEEMNSGKYEEIVLTGGIGSAKTTCALYSTAYQLYKLSCYQDPHALFGLDSSSEIVFIFQSITAKAAKTVDYTRFRAMIEKSPYFKKFFPFNKDLESELEFPKRIYVRPVSSKDTAAIGQNVFGGIIDEINFMAVIEKSKASIDGATYDQAKALYDSISKRRKSRFAMSGQLPGLLCLVSSARYPGQFTDRKAQEAQEELSTTGKTTIYIYDKCVWDVKPADFFQKEFFSVFVGDEARKPRILTDDDVLPPDDLHLVKRVPEDFRKDFQRDMMGSLRDIAGVATIARHPFIPDRERVYACVRKDKIIFGQEVVDFEASKLSIFKKEFLKPNLQRFVHCDLAITGDSAGFAVGAVTGFKSIERSQGLFELLPDIHIDALLEIRPPRNGEINLGKVREVIYSLKKLGLNITWVTFDQFQSRDSMQLLRQAGYTVGYQSIDINTMPYDFTKNALYDGRVSLPHHTKCLSELASLERDTKKNKIDHPPGMSKDVSDALAGVIMGLTMRREVWAANGIPLGQIPDSIKQAIANRNSANKQTIKTHNPT